MPEGQAGRCDLILLGWTAFVGFNLISDFLWGSVSRPNGDERDHADAIGMPAGPSELFRGEYRLRSNGSVLEEGRLRMSVGGQPTAMVSVEITSMALSFHRRGARSSFPAFEPEIVFSGLEVGGGARKMLASGLSDPRKFRFGPEPCQLHAEMELSGPSMVGGGRSGRRRYGGADLKPSSIVGEIFSPLCGVSVAFAAEAVDMLYMTQKVVHYSIWVNVLTVLQMRCFLAQMRHTEDGPLAGRVSIFCIAVQAIMDAYDSFLHLCLGLSSQYMFNTVAVISLFKFILFSLLEARYLLTIWRQRQPEIFNQGWDVVRRELSWLYSRFYGVLVAGLVLLYHNLDRLDYIVLAFQVYWLPQIVHDTWHGSKSALCPMFICGISATRLLVVLYLWGCPGGIFSGDLYPQLPGAPSSSICITAAALQAVQVGTMLLQRRWGPRWFVPWVCMPWAYNYRRSSTVDPGTDCVICMVEIDVEDARKVITPCNHRFHEACLEQWMEVKMECPTCRTVLPPIQ